ncbi:MAG: D-alanine--D-alanine ligase [bacterium]|nr:D-alanine--D-alanine ligase [bacterium]
MLDQLKTNKLTVGVLMGGPSAEHDVSLITGASVIQNLDRSKYKVIDIKITKDKEWFVGNRKMDERKALASCDIIFNALHGTFGEDGRVQALLEYYDKKYTGSGITASALAMDKLRSREMFRLTGFQVPKTLKIRKGENYQALLNVFTNKVAGFPVVVKPCSNGSSVGISIVRNVSQLNKALESAFLVEKKVLVEDFIEGTEVTCGVLENGSSISALPVTEIVPKRGHKFFDYDAKYKTGHSDEITPARIDEDTTKKVQEIAVRVHQLLGCRAYSRTDMIIQKPFDNAQGEHIIYVLETNTLPGLTPNSLLPRAALAAGLTMSQLVDKIIENSLA